MISTSMLDELYERAEKDGVALRIGTIIDRGGEVLLLERDDSGPIKATLKLPGTTVEPGEPLDAAVTRAVATETGLLVTRIRCHVGSFDYLSPVGKPVRRLHFAVDVAATYPIRLSVHRAYTWAPLDSELRVTPSIRRILEDYRKIAEARTPLSETSS
ncbi:NUDIX hydrolase [Nocardia africana]|uniref:NUDIX domain n=1 Tax=Nocardia africana TaxID=134964 RepID=A0A378WW77_9NOCA|nr:NUDIX domain-containing protein [Nocardia africana]MCC3313911.1 NUDIX domain-containing protein [Nocardia africana]SUA44701.1 NUDIX domain [Nocardia africana]